MFIDRDCRLGALGGHRGSSSMVVGLEDLVEGNGRHGAERPTRIRGEDSMLKKDVSVDLQSP